MFAESFFCGRERMEERGKRRKEKPEEWRDKWKEGKIVKTRGTLSRLE